MKNRIVALSAALAALFALFFVPSSAQAETFEDTARTNTECNTHDRVLGQSAGKVCMLVKWRKQNDGTGVRVEEIRIETRNSSAFEDGYEVDGYSLELTKGTTVLLWSRNGSQCDIFSGYRVWDLEQKVNGNAVVIYRYKARLNNSPDVEDSLAFYTTVG